MCGVLGLVFERQRDDLGEIASRLLRALEYRGYDSTGAAIQRDDGTISLKKDVGPPSRLVKQLGIVSEKGKIFCGQVRWATFGAVTAENAQPHVVRCKAHIYGAHNGNVTNCDPLKVWLESEGHGVRSDNDGEMVVHTVEHEFATELARRPASTQHDPAERRAAMRAAIVAACKRLQGSFAAVVVDPETRVVWAIKQGSSLYFGVGTETEGGGFGLASSDLSAVLQMTRMLVPLREGEFVEYDAATFQVHSVADGAALSRTPARSKLSFEDTALDPRFASFMEQEIEAQPRTLELIFGLFDNGGALPQSVGSTLAALPEAARKSVHDAIDVLRNETHQRLADVLAQPALAAALRVVQASDAGRAAAANDWRRTWASSEAATFAELAKSATTASERSLVAFADAALTYDEMSDLSATVDKLVDSVLATVERRGRVFVLSCGSSYNAACTGALFWNELARVELVPLLPGHFRERVSNTLRDGDLVITISQSGETKDLVDIIDDIIASGADVRRVGIVNNINSTIAQEKSDLLLPLRCGPEIAVPATKSFMAQLGLLYAIGLRVGERRIKEGAAFRDLAAWGEALSRRRAGLADLVHAVERASEVTKEAVEEAAKLLYQRPSLHLLATRLSGLAREGALKIREVVLDHAEGFEASEFKHGPNTLLGFNTVLGPDQVGALLGRMVEARVDPGIQARVLLGASPATEKGLSGAALFQALRQDYPLVFLTGPDPRDVALTISQLNTHKIRGAIPVVIAEEDAALRATCQKAPVDNPGYRWVYVALPKTGDTLVTAFTATVVLQRLALRMSILKSTYLDGLGIPDHGVHPDVPKNVSKSITVD